MCGDLEKSAAVMMFHFYLNVNVELRTHLPFKPKSALSRNFCILKKINIFVHKGEMHFKNHKTGWGFFVCVVPRE